MAGMTGAGMSGVSGTGMAGMACTGMAGVNGTGMACLACARFAWMMTGENAGLQGQLHGARLGLHGWRYFITLADRVLRKRQGQRRP